MADQTGCIVCKSAACVLIGSMGLKSRYECEVCGRYDASTSVLEDQLDTQHDRLTAMQRAVLSHRIREANDAGRDTPLLTTYEVDDVIANGRLPTPAQQAINVLRFVGNPTSPTGTPMDEFPVSFHASVGSPNRDFALRVANRIATPVLNKRAPHDQFLVRWNVVEDQSGAVFLVQLHKMLTITGITTERLEAFGEDLPQKTFGPFGP
jgi:hypothetical protein